MVQQCHRRNHSGNPAGGGRGGDVLLGAAIGTQLILAVNVLGRGMLMLGVLGASAGFGIQQAMQVLGNQGVDFASGEWRVVVGKPRAQIYLSIIVLILGLVVPAYAKTFGGAR